MVTSFNRKKGGVFASIDLGTNNCRLMIARPSRSGFCVVDSFSKITRLGEGMVSNNRLSPKAMERTLNALKICAERLSQYPLKKARFVATEACRRAENGADFIALVKDRLGLSFEIISSVEESRLAITGCTPLLKKDVKYLMVFDIGGGSSDIAFSEIDSAGKLHLKASLSVPMGVLTVSEGFTGTDLSGRARQTIADKIDNALEEFDSMYGLSQKIANGEMQIIGTSGTVTSLGAFHLNLSHYNRSAVDGLCLSFDEIQSAREKLEKMSNQERIMHSCIGPQRADLTLAGCAILGAICDFWQMDELMIADRGIREGILIDLMRSA